MAEKRDSDEFEDEDTDEAVGGDDPDLEHLIKDLETQKRRGGPKPGEPAWRRLEKYMEQKRTAQLLSDFDDYDLDEAEDDAAARLTRTAHVAAAGGDDDFDADVEYAEADDAASEAAADSADEDADYPLDDGAADDEEDEDDQEPARSSRSRRTPPPPARRKAQR